MQNSKSFFGLNLCQRIVAIALVSGLISLLSGCAMGTMTVNGADPDLTPHSGQISGGVHGGGMPVTGATLQLYAAGAPAMPAGSGASTGAYGTGASALITPGSMTLGSSDNFSVGGASGCVYILGNTNGCTALPTTDSGGAFVISNDYTCTAGQQVYLVATGGNPGLGGTVNNQYIALMAALGTCPAAGTFKTTVPHVGISEVSTVAAVWALQQFMAAPATSTAASAYTSQGGGTAGIAVNVGSPSGPGGGYGNSGVQTPVIGLDNAFLMVHNLVGTNSGLSESPDNSWATPWSAKINTIADILAYCVNSDPSTNATPCTNLMTSATPSGGVTPADTIQAAYYMATNPTNNVATLFGYVAGSGSPFTALGTAPTDWAVFVGLSPQFPSAGGNGVSSTYNGAFDAYGHLWLSNYNTSTGAPAFNVPFVSELAGDGSLLAGPFGNPASATLGGVFATANSYTIPSTAIGYASGTGCSSSTAHTLNLGSNGSKGIMVDLNNVVWLNNPDDTATTCTSSASIHTLMRLTGASAYAPTAFSGAAGAITSALVENGSTYAALGADQNGNVYAANSSTTTGKEQEYVAGGGATYAAGASLGASSPSAAVVDNSTKSYTISSTTYTGPFLWTVGSKSCTGGTLGQVYQQPLANLATAAAVMTYSGSGGTGCPAISGTFVTLAATTSTPFTLAVDRNNNLWLANSVANTVNFFAPNANGQLDNTTSTAITTTSGFGGLLDPFGLAVDGNNNVWVANTSTGASVSELTATVGSPITVAQAAALTGTGSTATGYAYPSSNSPFPKNARNIAIDPSGNVWFFNGSTTAIVNYLSVMVGQAAPVITPTALQAKANMIGQKP